MVAVKYFLFQRIYKKLENPECTPYIKLDNLNGIHLEQDEELVREVMDNFEKKNYVTPITDGTWKLVEDHWHNYVKEMDLASHRVQGVVGRTDIEV